MKNRKNKNYANSYRLKRSNKHDCRRSYNTIFINECVNIDGIKGGKSDYDNFVNIDKAVEYIKECNYLDREKHLNRVKATRKEFEENIADFNSSSSLFVFLTTVISMANLFNYFIDSNKEKEYNFSVFSINPIFKTNYFSASLKEPDGSKFSLVTFIVFAATIMMILVYGYFLYSIIMSGKYKRILKNLTYLEKQLESDK